MTTKGPPQVKDPERATGMQNGNACSRLRRLGGDKGYVFLFLFPIILLSNHWPFSFMLVSGTACFIFDFLDATNIAFWNGTCPCTFITVLFLNALIIHFAWTVSSEVYKSFLSGDHASLLHSFPATSRIKMIRRDGTTYVINSRKVSGVAAIECSTTNCLSLSFVLEGPRWCRSYAVNVAT